MSAGAELDRPADNRVRISHTNRFTILAVCTANICRSPLMELLLRRELDTSMYEVGSAGVRGFVNSPMDSQAANQAVRFGADPTYFRSRALTADMVGVSGLILTATKEHRSQVLSLCPTALRRTFTLLEFAQLTGEASGESLTSLIGNASRNRSRAAGAVEIDDPYRQGELVHQQIAERIVSGVRGLAVVLNSASDQDGGSLAM